MRTIGVSEELGAYIAAHANPVGDPIAEALAATTAERFGGLAQMNIGQDQGRFMSMLVALMGARTVVEVGTFTGMSALWLARGLPDGGRLVCFDITDKYLATAREAWAAADVDDRIEVRIGPAADGLAELPDEPHVDLAFIDADKPGYRRYLDLLLPRLNRARRDPRRQRAVGWFDHRPGGRRRVDQGAARVQRPRGGALRTVTP